MSANLSGSYPATAKAARAARHALVDFAAAAGASDEKLEAIHLAACEALTNVVVHAYREVAGSIHVNAAVIEDELWVIVADDGSGMQPRRDSPGLGYGLKLIADAADEVTIVARASAGTEVRMRFDLRDGGRFGDDQVRGSVASATAPAPSPFSTTR